MVILHKLILYGAGKRCRNLCKVLLKSDIKTVIITDSDCNKWEKELEGYQIIAPEALENYDNTYFCITPGDRCIAEEIRQTLQERYHFNSEYELSYGRTMLQIYVQIYWQNPILRQGMAEAKKIGDRGKSVLFDCYNGLVMGGVESWTMDLCQALIKSGRENVFIISDKGSYPVPPILESHILQADIDHRERFLNSSTQSVMDIIITKMPCTVVTCIPDDVMLAAYIVKCYCPDMVEIVSVIHNSNEGIYNEYMDFRDCADFHIGVSRDIQDDLVRRGISPKKITSMTCPFFCKQNLQRSYSGNSEPLRIGFAGRMEYYQKRMDLIMKLVAELVNRKVFFIMEFAGAGSAQDEMKEFVEVKHLEEKVRFCGQLRRSEIPVFWTKQDICINLADFEGRCISKLEAMANGTVPIITRTAGAAEDVVNGINGYIVPVGDYLAAADWIEYLSKHRERLQKMGSLAHDAVYPKSRMEPHLEFWKGILFGENRGIDYEEI